MKTVLVIAKESGLAGAVRSVLNPEGYRVLQQAAVWERNPLIGQGAIDVCLVDAELTDVRPIRIIEELRREMPECPILIFASAKQWEWEEEAYLLGVAHVLTKPVRGPLLNTLLERLWKAGPAGRGFVAAQKSAPESNPAPGPSGNIRALEVLRDFSGILKHGLCLDSLLEQFLLLLRKVVGVNRAVIFLRKPPGVGGRKENDREERRLRAGCALGLPTDLLEHFELSIQAGLGGHIYRTGRILRSGGEEALKDREMQKEFELLGVQVAIPILDRESLVGVAVFDGHLTGEPLGNDELALIFHLLEELGLAIKNSWLHDQLAAGHEMMSDILDHLSGGCIVVGRDLAILQANEAAGAYFTRSNRNGAPEFSDLPRVLGGKVFEALQSGLAQPPFMYRPPNSPDTICRVVITPFRRRNSVTANAVLVVIEDCTQSERAHELEVESAKLRLVRLMAEHMAHEIGNAIVPVSTHQQLLASKYDQPEFRSDLEDVLERAVHRISRLSRQMLFLAGEVVTRRESVPVATLIEEAFMEAKKHCSSAAKLVRREGSLPILVTGDHAGLKQALSEVMLNALQATPPELPIEVRSGSRTEPGGVQWIDIEVRDSGRGFSEEAAKRAAEPFFSTRNVGLGLGLAVTKKIIESHSGTFQLDPGARGQPAVVRISLPLGHAPEAPELFSGLEKQG